MRPYRQRNSPQKGGKGDDETERRENLASHRRIPANQDACEKSEENVQRSLSPRGEFRSKYPETDLQGVSTRRTIAAGEEDACKENKDMAAEAAAARTARPRRSMSPVPSFGARRIPAAKKTRLAAI